jgi:hypothetical protein
MPLEDANKQKLEACWAADERREKEWEAECDESHHISKAVNIKII